MYDEMFNSLHHYSHAEKKLNPTITYYMVTKAT